ncbi:MAG: hypothetical protein EBS55_13700 [Flavobacteriaceae bacterium]|nr:hypothetical protein [Flavobacteriaceae bacterium]
MNNENDLMQKLIISKKIMERHEKMPRSNNPMDVESFSAPEVQTFTPAQGNYNIPQEYLSESQLPKRTQTNVNTEERIMSSKLPDTIKRLMIEHPINQPDSMSGPTLSNDLVEKAARLMNTGGKVIEESSNNRQSQNMNISDNKDLRKILKEVVKEVLSENGLLIESTQKSNDTFSFKVGKHIFEGKVTKVKKIS